MTRAAFLIKIEEISEDFDYYVSLKKNNIEKFNQEIAIINDGLTDSEQINEIIYRIITRLLNNYGLSNAIRFLRKIIDLIKDSPEASLFISIIYDNLIIPLERIYQHAIYLKMINLLEKLKSKSSGVEILSVIHSEDNLDYLLASDLIPGYIDQESIKSVVSNNGFTNLFISMDERRIMAKKNVASYIMQFSDPYTLFQLLDYIDNMDDVNSDFKKFFGNCVNSVYMEYKVLQKNANAERLNEHMKNRMRERNNYTMFEDLN